MPLELERITAKLMSKEAEYRYQTAADLIADLKAADVSGSGVSWRSMAAVPVQPAVPAGGRPGWLWPTVSVAALLVGAGGAWWLKPAPAMPLPTAQHFVIEPAADEGLPNAGRRFLDVAPDGAAMLY